MDITDLHIKASDPEKSLAFPGPRVVTDEEMSLLKSLLEQGKKIGRVEYMSEYDGLFFRGRRDDYPVDGTWYRLRRMAEMAPDLDTLPSPIDEAIKRTLLSPNLTKGALVLVAGGPGCGKTMTASATVVSRLKRYGGFAYTIEDPPELPLNGPHGDGYCAQTIVAGGDSADWAESIRGALRSQPVGTNLIMYVGEVRDAEAAQIMIRAACSGFLVIGTCFGSGVVDAIRCFMDLAGKDQLDAFASVLRVVVYQLIIDGYFGTDMLVSPNAGCSVSAMIRRDALTQLENELMYQRKRAASGDDLLSC